MATGIRDKVAILGMGCSKFGERWDASPEDLMVESYVEAMEDAGIEPNQLDAAWFSHHIDDIGAGKGGTPMSIALRLPNIAVTRVENYCASGSEAFRGAVYAVAAGAADIAIAVGMEKLKDTELTWRRYVNEQLKTKYKYQIFNLGNTKSIGLKKIISLLKKNYKKDVKIKYFKLQKGDIKDTKSNISKAKKIIKF